MSGLSMTLNAYLARTYLGHFLVLLFALMSVIYFFDVVELIRRASKFSDVPLGLVLQMGLLKLPEVTQVLFPFAILFSAIYTFWSLTQKLELIVVRSAGFSFMQFLLPVLFVAVFAGGLQMTVLNPVGAFLISHYESLERTHLKRQSSQMALFQDGFWLRQNADDGYVILHSQKIQQPDWRLVQVSGLFFDEGNNFIKRIDAPTALLEEGRWVMNDVTIHRGYDEKFVQDVFYLPTLLTQKDVEESFASAETIPFWSLPVHIEVLEDSGFDASKLRVYYNNLLALPLMLAAMVMLAAGVSMRLPRQGSALLFVIAGTVVGLVVFFLSSFMQALGASQQIPVVLAAWAPALISFLFGLSLVLYQEEG